VRAATVISYGAEADGIITIARRAGEAASSDQVLLAVTKDNYALQRIQGWETLGMRGTCSAGFELKIDGPAEMIFPEAYEKIHAQTMTPVAHLCWSSVWAGVAADRRTRATFYPQGRAQCRRPDAAGCGAFHRGQDVAGETSRHDRDQSRWLRRARI